MTARDLENNFQVVWLEGAYLRTNGHAILYNKQSCYGGVVTINNEHSKCQLSHRI